MVIIKEEVDVKMEEKKVVVFIVVEVVVLLIKKEIDFDFEVVVFWKLG